MALKVAVVAEYYPRAADPVLGVWAHRQALAARDAGAEVRVLVLHRPVPSRAALASRDPAALLAPLRQPLRARLDGLQVAY
ncbi:MAG TPA: glycosyltransferase family 4 protein, partial [Solirubrobacteraceae bacterium]